MYVFADGAHVILKQLELDWRWSGAFSTCGKAQAPSSAPLLSGDKLQDYEPCTTSGDLLSKTHKCHFSYKENGPIVNSPGKAETTQHTPNWVPHIILKARRAEA